MSLLKDVAVVFLHVFPVIERIAVCRKGDGCLVLVEEEFHENVIASRFPEEQRIQKGRLPIRIIGRIN